MVERDISRWRYTGLENRILIRLAWIFGGVWLFTLFVAATVGYYVLIHEPHVKTLLRENIELKQNEQILRNEINLLHNVLSDFGVIRGYTPQSQEPDGSQMRPPSVVIEHR